MQNKLKKIPFIGAILSLFLCPFFASLFVVFHRNVVELVILNMDMEMLNMLYYIHLSILETDF